MTIRSRLFLSLGLLIAGVMAAAAASLLLLSAAREQLVDLRDDALQPVIQLGIVRDAYAVGIVDTAVKVRNALIDWPDAEIAVSTALTRIELNWALYSQGIRDPKEIRLAEEVELRRRSAETALLMLQAALEDRSVTQIGRFVDEVMYPSLDPITLRLAELSEFKTVVSDRITRDAEQYLDKSRMGMLLLLIFLAAVALFAAFTVHRRVTLPLVRMTDAMTAVADGDLQHHIPGTGKRDEIGQLARALKVFRNAGRELRQAQEQAEAATKAKSDFLATMSHEIRTPMNGVMSMAEMLELTRLDSDQQRMAKVIRESAGALLTVINDILDFSKIEAGKLDIETIAFSLGDVVDGIGELLITRADDKGLDLVVAIDPALADRRLGDPTRLRQVLLNLGGNAIKFTERGTVSIQVQAGQDTDRGDVLRFSIRDTGIGLTPEQCARLFKPFSQADSSTARKFGGTGLGLSICHRLCDMMGGRIGVDSVPGAGSVFWFELPLPAEAGSTAPAPMVDIAGGRVLLVGLPPPLADAAASYLQAAGLKIAATLEDLRAAAQQPRDSYDLVLVDARCEDPPGLEAPHLLGPGTACILAASRYLVSTLDAAAAAQFSASLTYPLHRSALWRAVAIARDLAVPDLPAATEREDMAFAPPDFDVAAAQGAMILVAEDNPTNQMVIRQMLARMGFACDIAKDGAAALKQYELERSAYGLLLTDFHMPEMDGFALTAAIRTREQSGGRARLPIIALTADALTGTEQKCFDAGMDGYLTKPIDSRALGRMLGQWLPQALALRQPAAAEMPESVPVPASTPALGWDSDIFDPAKLAESFGSFNTMARQLLQDFVADAQIRIDAINHAVTVPDMAAVRHLAHAMKGGALTIGIGRLGALASNLQDACDDNDAETVALMAELMAPTLDELRDLLPLILKS